MTFFKKKIVTRKFATYKADKKFQGKFSTFTEGFDKTPPKKIRGDHGITYKRVGTIKKKKVPVRQIGRYTFG